MAVAVRIEVPEHRRDTVTIPSAELQLTIDDLSVPVDEDLWRRLVRSILTGEARTLRISVVVVGDETIAQIHEESMGDPSVTDVIAFDLAGDGPMEGCDEDVDGEILVNAQLAVREAAEQGHSPEAELLFYVAHGLLHLLGFDDSTDAERLAMHRKQAEYLAAVGVFVKE